MLRVLCGRCVPWVTKDWRGYKFKRNLKSQIIMARYCMAVDLKDDPALIAEYERYHKNVWPEVLKSLHDSGIEAAEIYRTGNRLVMILETNESFSFEKKAVADASNPRVVEWEELMWKYQQPIPWGKKGVKWVVMEKVFEI